MLPLRNPTYVYAPARPAIVNTSSSPIASRQVTSLTRTSTKEQRVNVVEDRPTSVQPPRQSPSSAVKSRQQSRPWTSAGGSVLDELVSWRKLKEPLERYQEFARCNHFANADQSTDTGTRQREDGNITPDTRDTDNQSLSVPVDTIQQDAGRLLQRPRKQSHHHIASRHSSLQRR